MKHFTIIFFAFFAIINANAQSCLPQGIQFFTQSEIDNFPVNYPNCTHILGSVTIGGGNITNLNGLSAVTSIESYLQISAYVLPSLSGLHNLITLNGNLYIDVTDSLVNLTGLDSLVNLNGGIYLSSNHKLKSLAGIDNVISLTSVVLQHNDSLCDCSVESICNYFSDPYHPGSVSNNAPGCNSVQEIKNACGVGIADRNNSMNQLRFYPNPSSDIITVETSTYSGYKRLSIINSVGEEILSLRINEPKTVIDIRSLPTGMYLMRYSNDISFKIKKFIRE